jgi:hypothetical protein
VPLADRGDRGELTDVASELTEATEAFCDGPPKGGEHVVYYDPELDDQVSCSQNFCNRFLDQQGCFDAYSSSLVWYDRLVVVLMMMMMMMMMMMATTREAALRPRDVVVVVVVVDDNDGDDETVSLRFPGRDQEQHGARSRPRAGLRQYGRQTRPEARSTHSRRSIEGWT